MDWKAYWNQEAGKSDPHAQVARIGGQAVIHDQMLREIAARVAERLSLKSQDHLLDVCCGNGRLSQEFLSYCAQLTGVDLSEEQIARAQAITLANTRFVVGEASQLGLVLAERYDHAVLYFSFQYLERFDLARQALAAMKDVLKPGGKIFLGDVPEKERLSVFYPSLIDRFKYHLNLRLGRSLMGRFWSLPELVQMADSLDMRIERLAQPGHFPYAHYRADFVLSEK
ncbi:MAG: methyltransferase domain-containing protein [Bacteroidota bacterium]